jgi:hypothetical protein
VRETGIRLVDVYWSILGFGEYDFEEWWEVADWATLVKTRTSKALEALVARTWELDFIDYSRGQQTRMLRTTADVMAFPLLERKGE